MKYNFTFVICLISSWKAVAICGSWFKGSGWKNYAGFMTSAKKYFFVDYLNFCFIYVEKILRLVRPRMYYNVLIIIVMMMMITCDRHNTVVDFCLLLLRFLLPLLNFDSSSIKLSDGNSKMYCHILNRTN